MKYSGEEAIWLDVSVTPEIRNLELFQYLDRIAENIGDIHRIESIAVGNEVTKFVGIRTAECKMRGMFLRKNQGELCIGKGEKCPGVVDIFYDAVEMGGIPFDRLGHVWNRNRHMMD